jgi:hypothetical protein
MSGFAAAAETLEYNRDIRPILAENCFTCHGADSAARKAGLRIDQRDEAVKGGAIVPGNPQKSLLVERIFTTDAKQLMPPPKSHKSLTAAQKDVLRRWIAAGAEYQPHWSFIPPQRPSLPTVKNKDWARNPVDTFIVAELEKRGLHPAPEADRRVLARRLSLDLTGLPPAPVDVETFVRDTAPGAYERYVDRLLQSPHWGEHRGRYWLDAARYADTHGIHFDNFREIWAYRDWVIKAFNENKPFDRFTIEQLAGDLLPDRTVDQQVASGFHRCNITTNEGGVIPEEYVVLYARDRTETTAQVWLGLTAGCAVCHDHKYDPLTMRDFYSLSAFFNNTTQNAMDGNIKDTPPIIVVPRLEDRPRWEKLNKELAEARQQVEARRQAARKDFDEWLAEAKVEQVAALVPTDALLLHLPLNEGTGTEIKAVVDGKPQTISLAGTPLWDNGHVAPKAFKARKETPLAIAEAGALDTKQAFSCGAWVQLPRRGTTGAVLAQMDDKNNYRGWDLWIDGDRLGAHLVHKWPEDAIKVVGETQLQPRQWYHLFITYDGSGKAAGLKLYVNGRPEPLQVTEDRLQNTLHTDVPLKVAQRHTTSVIENLLVQDVRMYGRALTALDVNRLVTSTRAVGLLAKPAEQRTPVEKDELFSWWLLGMDPEYPALAARIGQLQLEVVAFRSRGAIAHVMQERPTPPAAFMLFRGEYDKRRDPVVANTPKSLPAMGADLPRNRLGLAQWLLRSEQPLTSRVTVNRFWQEIFGTGIVRTSGDFGIAGELPSHPELLDWLAVEFRESRWDIKKFFKLLVTSSAYRQAAVTTAEKREKDPQNRLLSRGPRFRMDAEMVRDYALAASGLLVPKVGGPSVKPYQPDGVWEAVAMIGSNTRDYRRDNGENLYRRSMYTFWKRSAPPASMEIFNAPNRETCAVRRERTNTPLQALVTLNDPQFVEAARNLAQAALKEGGEMAESRIDFIARRLLARPFRAEELKIVQGSLQNLLAHFQGHADEAKKLIAVGESRADPVLNAATLAAWTVLVNELMNLDEVLTK